MRNERAPSRTDCTKTEDKTASKGDSWLRAPYNIYGLRLKKWRKNKLKTEKFRKTFNNEFLIIPLFGEGEHARGWSSDKALYYG
jgi:hypothetical protein